MKKKIVSLLIACIAALCFQLVTSSSAFAGQLSVNGGTVSWDESNFYKPSSGCTQYGFTYSYGPTVLLEVISIIDSYGGSLGSDMSSGNNASGIIQLCSNQNLSGPLTLTLRVRQSFAAGNGSEQTTSTPITLLNRPVATPVIQTPVPIPVPATTLPLTPQTPQASVPDNSIANSLTILKLLQQIKTLQAKVTKICKVKPMPKYC
jgi:hypothetical protein